jgi:hypothetical protein
MAHTLRQWRPDLALRRSLRPSLSHVTPMSTASYKSSIQVTTSRIAGSFGPGFERTMDVKDFEATPMRDQSADYRCSRNQRMVSKTFSSTVIVTGSYVYLRPLLHFVTQVPSKTYYQFLPESVADIKIRRREAGDAWADAQEPRRSRDRFHTVSSRREE